MGDAEQSGTVPAYEAVAATLAGLGVDTAFGLLGSGNFHIAERLVSRHGVTHHAARHETAVVVMADAWARVTGRMGVCSVHQGPGLTNALTGLVEAVRARTPMLVIAGEVATTATHANQRFGSEALATAAGAGVVRVERGATAVRETLRAWRQAAAERRPVLLALPVDVQVERCELPPSVDEGVPPAGPPAADALGRAAALLASAQRPLVLGGLGAVRADAGPALRRLADRTGALLATTAQAHGLFADDPWSVGLCGGFASPRVRGLLSQADLVLAFGASLNHWTTGHGEAIHRATPVVQCDVDPAAFGRHRPAAAVVLGDARTTAEALLQVVPEPSSPGGFRADASLLPLAASPGWDQSPGVPGDHVHPGALMEALEQLLPPQRAIAPDSGHFIWYAMRHLTVPDASAFVFTQSFQSVGLGLATALGASIARPDRLTVAVVGDGGAAMSLGELDTVSRSGRPLLVVVMDDGAYGAEVHHFGPEGEPVDLVQFGTRDFAGIAAALGIPAQTVRSVQDLEGSFARWLGRPSGPFLLDCKIDPTVRSEQADLALRGGG
ncbi:thiamine pyrophosphate-binding protein [Geodermatophilus sabuli]|uniref:thiamine pyrophosphate-binding protein n=1 Tax=Geodermatophilus sabuli TaxID=1564158 RepID=UPI00195315B5